MVTANSSFAGQLEQRLKGKLPGIEAQYRMAHAVRQRVVEAPENAMLASVLALFYPKDEAWHLVLIERTSSNPNDRHSGQISFPGGKKDLEDSSLAHTALREAEEEVGVLQDQIHLLGRLTELYIPVSNFIVHPFVGITYQQPFFRHQESEVSAILEVPFRLFMEPGIRQAADIRVQNGMLLKDVPIFKVQGKVVWGATAMILSELLEVSGRLVAS
ncbi:MAG TPA: CoA pyrophosphatase [Saprospiraceae bacterium]|nr:CoA pyrophosphatase [Saprospiraceae bacterium]HMQ82776.1 CoA pyrophosphatase [Saprospiraceae bacterium]